MALVLVIGAVALDRPIRLDRPVRSGGRARGVSQGRMLGGRLGGGGSNAGCALRSAGHQVLVASSLSDDADGLEARRLAEAAGLDLRFTSLRPGPSSRTLIFIDPGGERTIIGLDEPARGGPSSIAAPSAWPDVRPDGLFIRAAYGGAADWAQATQGPVVLHWPAPAYNGQADVIVASADDLEASALTYEAARARLGPRLQWLVVTHGAAGAVAHGPADAITVAGQPRTMRDATGAGDIFAAGLLDALLAGAPIQRALEHACAWGGAAVELEGSAPVDAPPDTFGRFVERPPDRQASMSRE